MNNKSWREKYGEWALVTGASSGLGTDFAQQLAEKGMNIVLVARRQERLNAIAKDIENKNGIQTLVVPQDLITPGAAENVWNAVEDREVGVLVNNAGFGMYGEFHTLDSHRQAQMTYLNCLVPVILTQIFLPKMVERGKGAIIFLASTGGYQPTPFYSVYSASKGFNLLLGEALWEEYRKKGVDILALSPGYTETEFQQVVGVEKSYGAGVAKSPDVVAIALKSLGKKPSVIHGKRNWFLVTMERLVSRKMVLKITGMLMKRVGMSKNSLKKS